MRKVGDPDRSPGHGANTWRGYWKRRRWTLLALSWAVIYLGMGVAWALGAPLYPYGRHWDPSPVAVSLMDAVNAPAGTAIIIIAVFAALLALAWLLKSEARTGMAKVGSGAALVFCLGLVLVGDYRPLMVVARVPVFLISRVFFGSAEGQVGFGEFLAAMFSVPALHGFWQLGGVLLVLMAVAEYWRRVRRGCEHCGRPPELPWWETRFGAQRWGLFAAIIAAICPLPYALTRYLLVFGVPTDGISREQIEQANLDAPGIWIFGAGLATFGVLGSVLTLGLVQRWGERWPFWVPALRGRAIHPLVAVIPAGFVSLLWPGSSLMFVRVNAQKAFAEGGATADNLIHLVLSPMNLWIFWGFALAGATVAYWLRRRPDCLHCRRGEQEARGIWIPVEQSPDGKGRLLGR